MLSRIARGVPRFSITSERLSLSTRFSSLPKLDLARRAEITMPSLVAVLVSRMNSPVHLSELYSYKFCLSTASNWGRAKARPYNLRGEEKAGACRRRGRRGRGGDQRVRWRSSGARDRASEESHRRGDPFFASCTADSKRRGCGRNCSRRRRVAQRDRGTESGA